jgi:hypothetical protein
MNSIKIACLIFLFSPSFLSAQKVDDDTVDNGSPAHRVIFGGGFGLGMSSVLNENNSGISPEKYYGINLGYRLSHNFYLATGLLVSTDHRIQFERSNNSSTYSGNTAIIPLSINYSKNSEGVSPVFGIGVFYRTDQMGDDSELTIGNEMNDDDIVSNFGSHLKLGLAYTDYYSNTFFLKGARYGITFNSYTDTINDELQITSSVVMFRVAALF